MPTFTLPNTLIMQIRILLFLVGICLCINLDAQRYPVLSPKVYSSQANPHYWKNKAGNSDYWQQDVHYDIDANIDVEKNRIDGEMTLVYTNNSPDTLREVFFHLYQNAFKEGSYYDKMEREKKRKPTYGTSPEEGEGTRLRSVKHEGEDADILLDNTIVRVELNKPLFPNAQTTFDISFETYWAIDDVSRRMKVIMEEVKPDTGDIYEVKHLDGVLWYPRIAVYDDKVAWHVDQHYGNEFYGEFGSYDVSLTFPKEYILDATGVLMNREEVLPKSLMEQIAIERFADKRLFTTASEIIPPSKETKTWVFHAQNVHDFAFTADPTYRMGVVYADTVRCVALAREPQAARWQDAAMYSAKIIELFSKDFGAYVYPKIIVADADDGMEYPMLTLDGDISPWYLPLLAHEIGHEWFYGMLGSNETYRAMMDEGFTQFLEYWAMSRLELPERLKKDYKSEYEARWVTMYEDYITAAQKGYDGSLNTHSDDFHNYGGYGQVYNKTATMLNNLRYVLGEETFLGAMQHYVQKWKLKHPYENDFRQAVTEYVDTDLTWFFDQWLETDKTIDYAIRKLRYNKKTQEASVNLIRKGEMVMPIRFSVKDKEGNTHKFLVPVSWYVPKEEGVTILPRWESRGRVNPTYTATFSLPTPPKEAIIDPDRVLADVDLLDNETGITPSRLKFQLIPIDRGELLWDRYDRRVFPLVWWNGFSGFQFGLGFKNSYMKHEHRVKGSVWFNSGLARIESPTPEYRPFANQYQRFAYDMEYTHPLKRLGRNVELNMRSGSRDGIDRHSISLSRRVSKSPSKYANYRKLYAGYKMIFMRNDSLKDYLLFPEQWSTEQVNSYVWLGFERGYKVKRGKGKWFAELRAAAMGADNFYSNLRFESTYSVKLSKFNLRYRTFAILGVGNTPLESKVYLAGGNPEEMYESGFYRARGFFPNALLDNEGGTRTHHLLFGGGLNLRGYSGYQAEYIDAEAAWYGNNGASINLELEFGEWLPGGLSFFRGNIRLRPYLFYDAGIIGRSSSPQNPNRMDFDKVRQDAGIGLALELHGGGAYLDDGVLVIRADFPLFLSNPPAVEEFVALRWMLGIGRAF